MNYTNLFEPATLQHFLDRINKLTPATQAQWGKMNVSQMMAHLSIVMERAMSQEKRKRPLISYLLGPFFKGLLTDPKPYKPGTPTSPSFITAGTEKDFDTEKKRLIQNITKFSNGGESIVSKHPHPFFGKLTIDQWNQGQCKHLNHHLLQFGV